MPQGEAGLAPATSRIPPYVPGRSRRSSHIGNAALCEDARGTRLAKEHRTAARRSDAAVAAVMANYRAAALAGVTRASIFI